MFRKIKYWLIGVIILLFSTGCRITKYVPEDQFLLTENQIVFIDGANDLSAYEVSTVIKQKPNFETLGMKLKLRTYNIIKPKKVEEKRKKKNIKLREKNNRKIERENQINSKRIANGLINNDSVYIEKRIKLKDTLNPRRFFREWLKYSIGEPPKILDTLSLNYSAEQLKLFLNRKGFFDSSVETEVSYLKRKKAIVYYQIKLNEPFKVDTIMLNTDNRSVQIKFAKFNSKNVEMWGELFRYDSDLLADYRRKLASFMRDEGIYGFRESTISFTADTIGKDHSVGLTIELAPRIIEFGEEKINKPFEVTWVNKVYFHLIDTMMYKGNFARDHNLKKPSDFLVDGYLKTFDTLRYDWFNGLRANQRTATFLYNGKLPIKPELLEYQSLLEENNYYKGKLVDESFNHLVQLGLFRSIKPVIEEQKGNKIDVHYYLIPGRKQVFSFEPKATNSNGFLGVSTALNYQNKNLFGGSQKLKISFLGGFESQPPVFNETLEDENNNAGRSFNTFEYGPQIEYEIPGLFPMRLIKLNKRQMPKTVFSTAYNLQHRSDFDRQLLQINYAWRFFDVLLTQVFNVSIPIIGGIQYVNIDPSPEFENRLLAQNDLFLLNAYSDRFIWKDVKMSYQFRNPKLIDGKGVFTYAFNFDMAGMFLSWLQRNKPLNDDGFKEFLGVRYAQFIRLDNEFKFNHKLKGERSLNYRLQLGAGVPLGNNGPSLPFDYSFFAGGSNDIRGFRARSLGPGVYKYYLDTNRTATQIGDMRIGMSAEYRFKISSLFKGALFLDAGNIWTFKPDPNRIGGQISKEWYNQLAIAGGIGIRMDLDFLIMRFDLGIPLRNPTLQKGARWITDKRYRYIDEGIAAFGKLNYERLLPRPFLPVVQVGIGYPF